MNQEKKTAPRREERSAIELVKLREGGEKSPSKNNLAHS